MKKSVSKKVPFQHSKVVQNLRALVVFLEEVERIPRKVAVGMPAESRQEFLQKAEKVCREHIEKTLVRFGIVRLADIGHFVHPLAGGSAPRSETRKEFPKRKPRAASNAGSK